MPDECPHNVIYACRKPEIDYNDSKVSIIGMFRKVTRTLFHNATAPPSDTSLRAYQIRPYALDFDPI